MSVLVVLGLIWTAVLLPPALRARAARRAEFIDSFKEQMGALDSRRSKAGEVLGDARIKKRVSPVQRRRDILGGLLGALIGSLILGAFPSLRMVWVLHLFLLNTFIGYLALLAHQRTLVVRRERKAAVRAARSIRIERWLRPALDG